MSEADRTPDDIKADIEHTREELADTAAALAEKADVKARAHEKVEETKARFTHKVDDAKAKVTGTADAAKQKASDATPESVATGAQQAAGTATTKAKQNPIPVSLIGGFAAGVVVGWIVWSRR
ncbi:DUF3618 domain-containing protein [Baekduia sp. Peel2402]|uniref:DUF3618 domain-containing protein n=1 Tax=Baekduia sp. Peel2402 TaxID=3458296 RepID=UPI00403EA974